MSKASFTASTFPNHRYDFGDPVFSKTLALGGAIKGIRFEENGLWQYQLSCNLSTWTDESDLTDACPQCFGQWDGFTPCQCCGYAPED